MDEEVKLTVHQLSKDEVYLDIVRIPGEHRRTPSNPPIEEGKVCRLLCNGEEVWVIARGSERSDESICMDEKDSWEAGYRARQAVPV